jgi:UDP-glucose:(heptosyl)LPS alpha-1,3-glucosyltransferase
MTRKKIYFIREKNTNFGGAEIYLSRLSNALKSQNIQHKIIFSNIPATLPSWLRVVLFNLRLIISKRDRFYFSLERILCPDIYRAGDGVHKIFLSIEKKSKFNPLHPLYLYLEKRCFNNAKRIIANSEMVKREIIDCYQISPEKISVIYSGIELKEIDYESSFEKLSIEFGFKKKSSVILFVGSGYKRKGVYEFLKIIAFLENKDVLAFIIGKEKNIEFYKNLAKDLGIESQVIFTGARSDIDDFYAISDIFLFPTHYEPFGNVILEAMNKKNVIFTTKQNGASEILNSEFLMQSPSDYSVVDKINKLISNPKKIMSIQEHNLNLSKKFSIERNLEKTIKLIDEVIN